MMLIRSISVSLTLRKAAAWSVHLMTASGAIWGVLSLLALQQHDWKMSFIWITIAMLVDGFDGMLARYFQTSVYAHQVDGALMDNIIDFLNFVIVPVFFFLEAELLPASLSMVSISAILIASAYQFSQVDAKTEDHFFKGFPSYWNILALYLFLFDWGTWINLAIVTLCVVLVFVPIKYIYPSRTKNSPRLHQGLLYLWAAAGFIALMQYPNVPMWVIWSTVGVVAFYLISSLASTWRKV